MMTLMLCHFSFRFETSEFDGNKVNRTKAGTAIRPRKMSPKLQLLAQLGSLLSKIMQQRLAGNMSGARVCRARVSGSRVRWARVRWALIRGAIMRSIGLTLFVIMFICHYNCFQSKVALPHVLTSPGLLDKFMQPISPLF